MPDLRIDHQKGALENLVDLINHSNENGFQLISNGIRVTAPVSLSIEGIPYNTEISILPEEGSGYIDSATVRYIRLTLDQSSSVQDIEVTTNSTQETRAQTVMSTLGLVSSEVDIYIGDQLFDPVNNPIVLPSTISIRIKGNSILYIGPELQVSVLSFDP